MQIKEVWKAATTDKERRDGFWLAGRLQLNLARRYMKLLMGDFGVTSWTATVLSTFIIIIIKTRTEGKCFMRMVFISS